jgi:hypothetical protein
MRGFFYALDFHVRDWWLFFTFWKIY